MLKNASDIWFNSRIVDKLCDFGYSPHYTENNDPFKIGKTKMNPMELYGSFKKNASLQYYIVLLVKTKC